jgi:hypothetical protein
MNNRTLSVEERDRVTDLLVKHVTAYGNVRAVEKSGKEDVISKARMEEVTALETVGNAVRDYDKSKIVELCNHLQYRVSHEPVAILGKGKSKWDKRIASKATSMYLSLKNALKAVNKGSEDKRTKEIGKRGFSAKMFAELFNVHEDGSVVPQGGMNYNSVQFGLRKLDELIKKTQDKAKAIKFNDQYATAERSLGWLKPREQSSKPFTMGQSLGVTEVASAQTSAKPEKLTRRGGHTR